MVKLARKSLHKQQVLFLQQIERNHSIRRGMNPQLQNMLMQDAIIVQQAIEMSNVLLGIDSANKYDVFAPTGHKLGSVAEIGRGAGGFIMRQLFNNARACKLQIFDIQGTEIGLIDKPFRFIFSEMAAVSGQQGAMVEIGRAKRVTLFNRNYTISVGGVPQFTIQSSLFQFRRFKFDVMRNGVLIASIVKKFEGFMKMAFTQADNFSIQFFDKNLTLEERYTLFATLFLIDYDVFEQMN